MGSERELEVGDIHDVLRNDRRREVLARLHSNSGKATIRELSEHIAAVESKEDPPPRNVRQSVYVSLHQTHLPKLDELGIVDYDTDGKLVELQPEAQAIHSYLGTAESIPDRIDIGMIVVGLVGIGLVSVDVFLGLADSWVISVLLAFLFVVVLTMGGYKIVRART